MGAEIIRRALEEPARQIATNAGAEGSVVVQRLREMGSTQGFDAERLDYVDMFEAGIIDPAKVVRSALQNAASVSTLLLTSDALIAEVSKEDKKAAGGEDLY